MKFKLIQNNGYANGTSLKGYIHLKPIDLVRAFKRSELTDDYKVSGEYIFESDNGFVFTLYDYKDTSLYSEDMPSPEDFWDSDKLYEFHIGGHSTELIEEFMAYLNNEVQKVNK